MKLALMTNNEKNFNVTLVTKPIHKRVHHVTITSIRPCRFTDIKLPPPVLPYGVGLDEKKAKVVSMSSYQFFSSDHYVQTKSLTNYPVRILDSTSYMDFFENDL